MSKWQAKDLPIFLTMVALFISTFSDKISEFTTIPEKAILVTSCVIIAVPFYIWISGWLKNRK